MYRTAGNFAGILIWRIGEFIY